jgi:MinD superfamily P-loop ATPase
VNFCEENSIEIAGSVPFSPKVTEAMVNGKTITEYSPESFVAREIKRTWQKVDSFLHSL